MYSGIYDETAKCHRCQARKDYSSFHMQKHNKNIFQWNRMYCTDCYSPEFRAAIMDLKFRYNRQQLLDNPLLIETFMINTKIKKVANGTDYEYHIAKGQSPEKLFRPERGEDYARNSKGVVQHSGQGY